MRTPDTAKTRFDWLKTPTAVVLWTQKKTYMLGIDDSRYEDVMRRLDTSDAWEDICALVDPEAYSLEVELE